MESDHFEIPLNTLEFIDLIDRAYPQRCMSRGESLEDHHRYAGMRELIDEMVQMKLDYLEGQADGNP